MARKLVSVDWAMKRLLRSKANFGILEGFLSELLAQDVRIEELLESESNQELAAHKYNRVDLKCRSEDGQLLIIEVQYERQDDFLSRMLFSTSKVVTEHLHSGVSYREIPKVISVNLVYFPLGHGEDYVYHGTTRFYGLHKPDDELCLNAHERAAYQMTEAHQSVSSVFPEYYILRINDFDGLARDGLDEWMQFLKTETIPDQPKAKGLLEAKKKLDVLQLSDAERRAYESFEQDLHQRASMVESHYGKGKREGRKEGRQEGLIEGQQNTILKQLRVRFGSLSEEQEALVRAASAEQLDRWAEQIFAVDSIDELFRL